MMDSACAEYDVLRNDVVPAEQMMCLRNDVPLRGNGGTVVCGAGQ